METNSETSYEGSTIVVNDTNNQRNLVDLTPSVTDNLFEIQDQNLIESLSRETIIGTGKWDNSNNEVVGVELTEEQMRENFVQPRLFSYSFPDAITRKSNFIKDKLANIAYMRADVEITLKVQATPFVQGILWMYQNPYADKTVATRNTLNEHMRSLTSFPGVELNLQSVDRSVTMHLPYTSEYQVVDPRSVNEIATVTCNVLLPLESDETVVTASWVVLAKLTNIKLYGLSPRDEGGAYNTGQILTQSETIETQGEDEQASKKGIISGVSSVIGRAGHAIGDMGIPIISTIAKPVGWIADAVSGVASLFGFSRPHYLKGTTTYANVPARAYTNLEGLDNSVVLGCIADNSIECTKTTFDGKDEMHIQYLADRPYVYNRYFWTTLNSTGDILANIPVSPCNFSSYGVTRFGKKTIFGAPISLATSLFKWWRGRPTMTLKFGKTQFHQGRLLVQYMPYGNVPAPTEEVLSWIVDLSQVDTNGHVLEIPLVIRNKWLNTYDSFEKGYDPDACGGNVVISVLTDLIAAPTVSQRVTFLVWEKWNDFEVAELGTNTKVAVAEDYVNVAPSTLYVVSEFNNITITADTYMMPLGFVFEPFAITLIDQNSDREETVFEYTPGKLVSRPITPGTYSFTVPEGIVNVVFDAEVTGPPVTKDLVYDNYAATGAKFEFDQASGIAAFMRGTAEGSPTGSNVNVVDDQGDTIGLLTFGGLYICQTPNIQPNRTLTMEFLGVYDIDVVIPTERPNLIQPEPIIETQGEYIRKDNSSLSTTMGESVVSLRAATRRATLSKIVKSADSIVLDGLPLTELKTLRQSYVDIISYMYRFIAGSVRYKIVTTGLQAAGLYSKDRVENTEGVTFLDYNGPTHIQQCDLNPIIEVEQPFYSPAENLVMNSSTFDSAETSLSRIAVTSLDGAKHDYHILKAAGDDMTFTFLVGAPAFIVGPRYVVDKDPIRMRMNSGRIFSYEEILAHNS